jgi:hypothetical protein
MKAAHETNARKNIAAARGRREDGVLLLLLLLLLLVVVAKIIVVVVVVVVVVWYSPRRWCLFVKEEETFGRGFFREVFFWHFWKKTKKKDS